MYKCNIIAHRGANKYAPQNTLPAFEKAIQIGVDGFETDVHLTKDGVPVVCHNYTVDETSNGIGSIATYEFEELRKLDFGSYFSPFYKGTVIPTLDEFLDECEKGDIRIMNIELKSPKNGEKDIVAKTLEAVKRHGLSARLILSSFDAELLIEAKKIDPTCKTALLYCFNRRDYYTMFFRPVRYAEKIGADYLHPMYTDVSKAYVNRAHKAGIRVNVWTVDSERMIKKMIKCGVDGIITDCPDRAKKILKTMK